MPPDEPYQLPSLEDWFPRPCRACLNTSGSQIQPCHVCGGFGYLPAPSPAAALADYFDVYELE